MIDVQDYFDLVVKGFTGKKATESEEMTIFTEDVFRWRWMSRLRIMSFVTLADELSPDDMKQYMMTVSRHAMKARSKFGEPSCCIGVVMCENPSQEAIDFALQRPQKHPALSRYSVVADLKTGEVHYYCGPILYGILYEKFEREYINGHFALPMEILKQKL